MFKFMLTISGGSATKASVNSDMLARFVWIFLNAVCRMGAFLQECSRDGSRQGPLLAFPEFFAKECFFLRTVVRRTAVPTLKSACAAFCQGDPNFRSYV
jgi:hypothetical protein